MPRIIEKPTQITAEGTKPKLIEEHIGRVNTGTAELSIAKMSAPPGWTEPGQRPEFTEYTLVLKGSLIVEHEKGKLEVVAGQTVVAEPGEWVRYSTSEASGAEYVAVCMPAFSPDIVHRD
ncbi:MAG: cupin domain-containing protein [Spirochaetales bacterium]